MLQQKISEGYIAKIILRFIALFSIGVVLGVIAYLYSNPDIKPIFEPTPSVIQPTVTPAAEEGVILTVEKKEYQIGEAVRISVKNNLAETIFLGGCNQFDLESKENDQWKIESPLKNCIWEGNAVKINSKEIANYTFDAFKSGTFRINISYSKGCNDGKPVSQANCKASNVKYSAEFTVFEAKQAVIGEDFLIILPSNPSTGYSWTADFDKNYLTLRSKDYVADKVSPETVGAGGTEVFTFTPIKAGEVTIAMNYERSWENIPTETKVFKYTIKEVVSELPADLYDCKLDADCLKVDSGCCGCNAGGNASAINKIYENIWKSKISNDCKEISCPAVMSSDPSCSAIPKCVNSKCTQVAK